MLFADVELERANDPLWELQQKLAPDTSDIFAELAKLAIDSTEAQPATASTAAEGDPQPDDAATSAKSSSKFKWSTALDQQFSFDFKSAMSHQDLANINWTEGIAGVQRSDAGAEVANIVPQIVLMCPTRVYFLLIQRLARL